MSSALPKLSYHSISIDGYNWRNSLRTFQSYFIHDSALLFGRQRESNLPPQLQKPSCLCRAQRKRFH